MDTYTPWCWKKQMSFADALLEEPLWHPSQSMKLLLLHLISLFLLEVFDTISFKGEHFFSY